MSSEVRGPFLVIMGLIVLIVAQAPLCSQDVRSQAIVLDRDAMIERARAFEDALRKDPKGTDLVANLQSILKANEGDETLLIPVAGRKDLHLSPELYVRQVLQGAPSVFRERWVELLEPAAQKHIRERGPRAEPWRRFPFTPSSIEALRRRAHRELAAGEFAEAARLFELLAPDLSALQDALSPQTELALALALSENRDHTRLAQRRALYPDDLRIRVAGKNRGLSDFVDDLLSAASTEQGGAPEKLKSAWRIGTDPDELAPWPLIAKDRVLLHTPRRIEAHDLKSGALLWTRKRDGSPLSDLPAAGPDLSLSTLRGAVVGSRYFFVARPRRGQSELCCLSIADGRTLWRRPAPRIAPSAVWHPVLCSDGARLYAASYVLKGKRVHTFVSALDAQSGQVQWRTQIPVSHALDYRERSGLVRDTEETLCPLAFQFSAGRLYFADQLGHLTVMEQRSGRPLFVFRYPRTVPQRIGGSEGLVPKGWEGPRLLLEGDRCVLAPMDAEQWFCVLSEPRLPSGPSQVSDLLLRVDTRARGRARRLLSLNRGRVLLASEDPDLGDAVLEALRPFSGEGPLRPWAVPKTFVGHSLVSAVDGTDYVYVGTTRSLHALAKGGDRAEKSLLMFSEAQGQVLRFHKEERGFLVTFDRGIEFFRPAMTKKKER